MPRTPLHDPSHAASRLRSSSYGEAGCRLAPIAWLGRCGPLAGYVAIVVLLTAIGLYVSSLSSSGLRALLLSSGVLMVLVMAVTMTRIAPGFWPLSLTPINLALLVAFVVLLLGLAFDNHRNADRNARRVYTQLFILWGCLTLEFVVVGLLAYR